MQCTNWLVCKWRTALLIFQQSLALPRFDQAPAFDSHDARRALHLACMEASLTPTCAGHTQACSEGRSMSLLLQSSTAAEDQPHQFHLLHLCQQMDPHSHDVHRTSVRNYIPTTALSQNVFTKPTCTTLKSNMKPMFFSH